LLGLEEFDFVPFAVLTPHILSHQHNGESIYDKLKEIQDQKTALIRQTLDNMYALNNQRTYVNTKAKVNLNDLMTSRIGGVVRGQAPMGEAISPIPTLPIGGDSFSMLEYLDRVRAQRAGVDPENMSQNNMVGSDTAHGLERIMTAKEKLVGLIIRTFAETGIKQLVNLIRRIESQFQDTEKVIELRGKFTPVNPSEWRDRTNTTIKVGLGTGDQQKQLMALESVFAKQEKAAQMGLVQPEHVYAALQDFGKLAKLPGISSYFLDPRSEEAQAMQNQPPPPDPQMELLNLQAQIEQEKIQLEREKMQAQAQTDAIKSSQTEEIKRIEMMMKAELEEQKLAIERGKLSLEESELRLKAREAELTHLKEAQDAEISALQEKLMSLGSVVEALNVNPA
jgi:hypothetical protein